MLDDAIMGSKQGQTDVSSKEWMQNLTGQGKCSTAAPAVTIQGVDCADETFQRSEKGGAATLLEQIGHKDNTVTYARSVRGLRVLDNEVVYANPSRQMR